MSKHLQTRSIAFRCLISSYLKRGFKWNTYAPPLGPFINSIFTIKRRWFFSSLQSVFAFACEKTQKFKSRQTQNFSQSKKKYFSRNCNQSWKFVNSHDGRQFLSRWVLGWLSFSLSWAVLKNHDVTKICTKFAEINLIVEHYWSTRVA